MIDLTQFLVSGSDNGGNFTAATDSVDASIMGDIIDLAAAGVGCHTITYTLQDGVANGCGVAQDEFILCIEASGDATGITFDPFYCEGADVTLPGTAGGLMVIR